MIVLGLNGGVAMSYNNVPMFGAGENHDAAAALLIDGQLVGAIEEERLNRIKHSNKFPMNAIRQLLTDNNLDLSDVDYFSIYATEEVIELITKEMFWFDSSMDALKSPKDWIVELFETAFDFTIDPNKIRFVDHHMAHAASTYHLSGFDESLILTIDGVGGKVSGRVLYGKGMEMTNIHTIEEKDSLGHYYGRIIKFMGYGEFEEYKVMGLAPYGDPSKYREVFENFYELLPNGEYKIDLENIFLLYEIGNPRRRDQEFGQLYKDVAAALQESLEKIVLHILKHHRKESGLSKLCLAGGVAHNCSANGKILYSGLFDEVFIQPASHDAGNSVGAAIHTYVENASDNTIANLDHVFLGTDVEEDAELAGILEEWSKFLDFEKVEDVERKTAELIADGNIIGWIQGKSEFGPRALGNRSILADPRPDSNKDIINMMVKKREAYRPFAPSVLTESAPNYFELSGNKSCLDYMTFVVRVKEQYQRQLGAITHVDGTARIQTVTKTNNSRYWNLINEFGKITGIPIVLNTSFNNNAEPIVNSAEDAITCFLTTGINYLVIGDYIIAKKETNDIVMLAQMTPKLRHHAVIHTQNSYDNFNDTSSKHVIGFNYSWDYNSNISKELFDMAIQFNGEKTVEELMPKEARENEELALSILNEIGDLWDSRFISLSPVKTLSPTPEKVELQEAEA